jgi:hypothetical protein
LQALPGKAWELPESSSRVELTLCQIATKLLTDKLTAVESFVFFCGLFRKKNLCKKKTKTLKIGNMHNPQKNRARLAGNPY